MQLVWKPASVASEVVSNWKQQKKKSPSRLRRDAQWSQKFKHSTYVSEASDTHVPVKNLECSRKLAAETSFSEKSLVQRPQTPETGLDVKKLAA